MDEPIWNLDELTAADLFGVGPADGHDACEDVAEKREIEVTRALEENVEPCIDSDLAATRWVLVAEYVDEGGRPGVRLHAPDAMSPVDVRGLLSLGGDLA